MNDVFTSPPQQPPQQQQQQQQNLDPAVYQPLIDYNTSLERAFLSKDAKTAISLLRLTSTAANAATQIYLKYGGPLPKQLPDPWTELPLITQSRFLTTAAIVSDNWEQASHHLGEAFQKVITAVREDTKWSTPIMHGMASDLRTLSIEADIVLRQSYQTPYCLEQAERLLKKGFTFLANDRNPIEVSKKEDMLEMANQLFKIYFKMNNLRLCSTIIGPIQRLPQFEETFDKKYGTSQRVTYRYFRGRLALYDENFSRAIEDLEYAFRNTPRGLIKNRKLILMYLVPAKMFKGVLPKRELLDKYEIDPFKGIVESIRKGNIYLFEDSLQQYEMFFIKKALYLALTRLQHMVYRTLIIRIWKMGGETSRIKIDTVVECLNKVVGKVISRDSVECILANLIYKRFIRGYIAHVQGFLVLSKKTPFPPISTITT